MTSGLSGARQLGRLRKRADFLSVASARRKSVTPGVIVQVKARASSDGAEPIRLGFTASRKVGNSVARNRARRRLRALARDVLAADAAAGLDIVLIARPETVERSFAALRIDLTAALRKLGAIPQAQESAS